MAIVARRLRRCRLFLLCFLRNRVRRGFLVYCRLRYDVFFIDLLRPQTRILDLSSSKEEDLAVRRWMASLLDNRFFRLVGRLRWCKMSRLNILTPSRAPWDPFAFHTKLLGFLEGVKRWEASRLAFILERKNS